jgi:hypothetical protein
MSSLVHARWLASVRNVILSLMIIAAGLVAAPVHAQIPAAASGQRNEHEAGNNSNRDNSPGPDVGLARSLSFKQKQSIMQANFLKSKSDAAELAVLAKDLCNELDKPNADVLSLGVVTRMERIEKLAKKIRDETKGF